MPEPMDKIFADFETGAAGTFRPAPVEAVATAVRRRRRTRQAGLALLVAATVLAPAVTVGHGGDTPPTTGPTPSPRISPLVGPPPPIEARPVTVPGMPRDAEVSVVFPRDGLYGWALLSSCPQPDGGCAEALAATSDGGRTWRRTNLPDLHDRSAELYPLDHLTVVLKLLGRPEDFLVTRDGGATFTPYPASALPEELPLAESRLENREGWVLRCPGEPPLRQGEGGTCPQEELADVVGSRLPVQPRLGGRPDGASVVQWGTDGRLWVVTGLPGGRVGVQVSDDYARSWRELPAVAYDGPNPPGLRLSLGGTEAWLVGERGQLWRLADGRWQPRSGLPTGVTAPRVVALGGDILLVSTDTGVWRLVDGTVIKVPGLPAMDELRLLADGSIVGYGRDSWLSPGGSMQPDRPWYRLTDR